MEKQTLETIANSLGPRLGRTIDATLRSTSPVRNRLPWFRSVFVSVLLVVSIQAYTENDRVAPNSPVADSSAGNDLAVVAIRFKAAEASLGEARTALRIPSRRQAAAVALDAASTALAEGYAALSSAKDAEAAPRDGLLATYEALKGGIEAARGEYVRLEVDRLLAEAQHSYELSNFDLAYDSLAKASSLWILFHPDLSYAPLDFWMNLVRRARDTSNTRGIMKNDPLYREMTQYLSLARMKYEDGIRFQKASRPAEARKSFDEALAIIANVLRTFPLNADAGFLSLQILKATNEADFRASLPNRIGDAAALLKSDPAAAYARISDLARLEPGNAQLQRLLTQAEIATGKRRPEPSAADKSRSLQLTEQARQLMKTGKLAALTLAEQQLAEALGLDPDNREAQGLSLSIQTLRGGVTGRQLDADQTQRLNDARLLFSQGQYNLSRDALDPLLADEAARTRDVLLLDARLNQLGY